MALPKRNRGIRPIAVGETLRRSISSCAMDHVSKSAAEWFNPSQLGIATSNGTESIVHAVRRVHEHHGNNSEYAILSGDLSNGFNLVKPFSRGYKNISQLFWHGLYTVMATMRRISGVVKTLSGVSLAYSRMTHLFHFFLLLRYTPWRLN